MGKIFISYRRSDSVDVTGRICDHLSSRFGADRVFRDFDSIPVGTDFRKSISKALRSCDVLVAVIGPDWLNCGDANGKRRLEAENDLVRLELEAAMKLKLAVIPVLVGDSEMPRSQDLPKSLRAISYRNATKVRSDQDFSTDINRLSKAIHSLLAETGTQRPKPETSVANQRHTEPKRSSGLRRVIAFSGVFFLLLLLIGLAFEGMRASQFAKHAKVSIDTGASEKQLVESRDWFIEYSNRFNGLVLARPADEALPYVAKLESKIDQTLYLQVLANLDAETCAAYTDAAPLKTMLPEVSRYLEYLNVLQEKGTVDVSIEVSWDKDYEIRDDHSFQLTVNGERLSVVSPAHDTDLDQDSPGSLKLEPGTRNRLGISRFKLSDEFAIEARLTRGTAEVTDRANAGFRDKIRTGLSKTYAKAKDYVFSGSPDSGMGSVDHVKLSDLRNGLMIELQPNDDRDFTNHAYLVTEDPLLPELPELPAWRDRKSD